MGSFNGDIKTIQNSRRGEDVRDAIIDALKIINGGNSATSLNGIKAEEFVKRSEWESVFANDGQLLDHVSEGSTVGAKSSAIYELILQIRDKIDEFILRDAKNASEGELEKVRRANESINDILAAIRERNPGSLTSTSPLSDYPDAIRNIENTSNVKVGSITITENGTYPKEESNVVYNQVTVNVKENLIENKKVTKLNPGGTLTLTPSSETEAENKQKSGYKSVDINVSGQLQTLRLDETALKKSDNSSYDLAKETCTIKASDKDDTLAFKEVDIDLKSKIADLEIAADPDTDNGRVFNADQHDGIDSGVPLFGYRKVHITIAESKTKFTVTFTSEDGKKILEVVNDVPKHGTAKYTKSKPTKSGYYFAGWVPDPVDVCENMTVSAHFEKEKDKTSSGSESEESWEEMGQNGGVNADIGSWKNIYAKACSYHFYDNATKLNVDVNIPATYYKMVKVAEGEGGTSSTWISEQGIPGTFTMYKEMPFIDLSETNGFFKCCGWRDSDFRKWLNSTFYASIATSKDKYNGSIGKKIKEVTKYTKSFDTYTGGPIVYSTVDKIWLPSQTECGNSSSVDPGSINYVEKFGFSVGGCSMYRSASGGEVGSILTGMNRTSDEVVYSQIIRGITPNDAITAPDDQQKFLERLQSGIPYAAYISSPLANIYVFIGVNMALAGSSMDNSSNFNIGQCTFQNPRFGFCL